MNAQYTRRLVEEARAALADNPDVVGSGSTDFFSPMPPRDKEFLAREKIRLEIVREVFDANPDAVEPTRPAFAHTIAKLLRLS